MESLLKPENQAASPAMVFACVCKKISSIPYVRLGVKPRGFKEFGPIVITYSDGKLHAHDCTLSNKTTAERLLKCMCIFQKHGKRQNMVLKDTESIVVLQFRFALLRAFTSVHQNLDVVVLATHDNLTPVPWAKMPAKPFIS